MINLKIVLVKLKLSNKQIEVIINLMTQNSLSGIDQPWMLNFSFTQYRRLVDVNRCSGPALSLLVFSIDRFHRLLTCWFVLGRDREQYCLACELYRTTSKNIFCIKISHQNHCVHSFQNNYNLVTLSRYLVSLTLTNILYQNCDDSTNHTQDTRHDGPSFQVLIPAIFQIEMITLWHNLSDVHCKNNERKIRSVRAIRLFGHEFRHASSDITLTPTKIVNAQI